MTIPNPSTALARAVVDELAAAGVEVLVVSPGSRSGALAIAAAEHPSLRAPVVIDERSAAFHALGVARASSRPAAVLATSGTAVANHFPAIVEADMSCVPLVALSADRPAELRGVGANQTIDQIELFGGKVRQFAAIEAPQPGVDGNESWRRTVRGAVAKATGPQPGPVHLNVAFREPTVPVGDDGRTSVEAYPFDIPRIEFEAEMPGHERPLPNLEGGRGLVIAGDGEYDRDALLGSARNLGWPVLATALSGLRGREVVANYRGIIGRGLAGHLVPETVVAIGSIGPDQALEALVGSATTRVRIDRWGRHIDPARNAVVLIGDPVALLSGGSGSAPPDWRDSWLAADHEAREHRISILMGSGRLTGGVIAAALNDVDWGALVVASSLPVREVDAHLDRPGPVFANRGASGIDGFVSMSVGVASVTPGTLALAGDISFLHDSNGLLLADPVSLAMIVVDNGGGGLFDSLPQREHAPEFERLFITNPNRDLAGLARFHGARVAEVGDVEGLRTAASEALERDGLDVILARVDRQVDLAQRRQLG